MFFALGTAVLYQNGAHVSVAGRDVAYWKPAGPAPAAGYPLIVFSHGYTGCNTQSTFLMTALAEAGYLVLAPNHKDALCGTARQAGTRKPPERPLGDASQWDDSTYRVRAADVKAVLDAALAGKSFEGVQYNPVRVGLAGHSFRRIYGFGAGRGLAVVEKVTRIKAVLALSPFCTPFIEKGMLNQMNIPVMYQGGWIDFGVAGIVAAAHGRLRSFRRIPKYYVELQGAGHFAWTDLNKSFQKPIDTFTALRFSIGT